MALFQLNFVTPNTNMSNMSAGFGDWCALPLFAVLLFFILFTGCDFSSFTGGRNVLNNVAETKDSNKLEIENFRVEQKDKIEVVEYENNQLKEVVLVQTIEMHQRNSEIESLINLVEGILAKSTNSGELKEGEVDSPKDVARLEHLHHLILEMSSVMVGLRLDIEESGNTISELNGEVSRQEKSNEELASEIKRKDERHREMENQLATANERIVVLQHELLNEQTKKELLEKETAEKDNKIESLTCNVHRPVDGKTQTSEELKKLREEVTATNAKIDRLQEENCLKEKRLSEVERRLEHLANKFEERSTAAETLKTEGQEERLREERHSQGTELCEISAPIHQSLLRTELVIEIERLEGQLGKGKEIPIQFTPMGGHTESLANEDMGQLQSSEAIDSLSSINGKELKEVRGSTGADMQSLSDAIDHLLKLLSQEKNKDRAAATQMVADLQNQKRLLGFRNEDMAMKAHLDTHIHVLNRARGKDIQIQMDKILECMCQSKPTAEDVNIPKNSVLSAATQEEEVLLDPKYATDELISTKEETSSIANEVLGTPKTVTSSEDFIFVHEGFVLREEEMIISSECIPGTGEPFILPEHLGHTAQSAPVVPEDLCPTPEAGPVVQEYLCPTTQTGPVVPKDLCLIPEAAPNVREDLLMTKEKDAFQVEGAAFSGVEQALRNEREALNMERLAHIREKEAFAAEREAFYKNKEKLDENKDALQREMATFYREKEEFDRKKEDNNKQLESFTKKIENIAWHWQDKKEILDKQEQEHLQEIILFEEKKAEFIQEREEFQKEKEAIHEKELDEYKDALQREMATFYREKEEFDRKKEDNNKQLESFIKKIENIACHWQDKKEMLDKQEQELLHEIILFEEKKTEFIQEIEEFQKEKEAIYEKEQVTIECMERLEKIIAVAQKRDYLNWNVTNEREVQMEQKIKELEEIIEQQHKMLIKCETRKCELLQVVFRAGFADKEIVQQILNETKHLFSMQ